MIPGPNYLLLLPLDTEEKATDSGIIYKTARQEDDSPTRKGRVLQVGSRVNGNMVTGRGISNGDNVNYFGTEANNVEFRGDKLVLVHLNGIVSID